jgi:hypothetical protein
MTILIKIFSLKYFENNSKFDLKLSIEKIVFLEELSLNKNGLFLLHCMKNEKTFFIKGFLHKRIKYYVAD